MALVDWIAESKDLGFRDKVDFYAVKAATDIIGEQLGAMTANQHAKRVALANQVLAGAIPEGIYTSICTYASVQAEIDDPTPDYDGLLAGIISAIWDDFAGYDLLTSEPPA